MSMISAALRPAWIQAASKRATIAWERTRRADALALRKRLLSTDAAPLAMLAR
jgi:hypothetical protein